MYKNTKEKGITLVVLVITIILLLILAGITISYITGGGLIDKTQVAMNEYENADKKQQDIIDEINEKNKEEIDLEPVYSEEGAEDNIAPAELFTYEIINDGSVATTYMDKLPTKTVRIKGIKPEYCNVNGYDPIKYVKKYIIEYKKNKKFEDILNIKIFTSIDNYMTNYFFHNDNNKNRKTLKKEFINLLDKPLYKDAINKIKKERLSLYQRLVLKYVIKKIFFVLKILKKIKSIIKSLI